MKLFGKVDAVLLDRNIGKNLMKSGTGSTPAQGAREVARRLRQEAAKTAKAGK